MKTAGKQPKGCRVGHGNLIKNSRRNRQSTRKTVKTAVFRVFRLFFWLFFGCFTVTHSAFSFNVGHLAPPLTLQPCFFGKARGTPKKARAFPLAEPLQTLEKRGKTPKKQGKSETKKAWKSKKARIGGSGSVDGCRDRNLRPWKLTKMTKMAGVTQTNDRFPKRPFRQPRPWVAPMAGQTLHTMRPEMITQIIRKQFFCVTDVYVCVQWEN